MICYVTHTHTHSISSIVWHTVIIFIEVLVCPIPFIARVMFFLFRFFSSLSSVSSFVILIFIFRMWLWIWKISQCNIICKTKKQFKVLTFLNALSVLIPSSLSFRSNNSATSSLYSSLCRFLHFRCIILSTTAWISASSRSWSSLL